ncbi:hypothetical protein HN51_062942 [Arachis hypogaea]
MNKDWKSSLLSLVKAFNPVLAIYEGFCNLKQVDLKLKICRGSSVKKILVREAIVLQLILYWEHAMATIKSGHPPLWLSTVPRSFLRTVVFLLLTMGKLSSRVMACQIWLPTTHKVTEMVCLVQFTGKSVRVQKC